MRQIRQVANWIRIHFRTSNLSVERHFMVSQSLGRGCCPLWTGANRGDYSWGSTRCVVSICPMEIIAVELLFALIKQFAPIAPMTILPLPLSLPLPLPQWESLRNEYLFKRQTKAKWATVNGAQVLFHRQYQSHFPLHSSPLPCCPLCWQHMVQIFDLTIRRKYNNLAEYAKVSPSPSPSPSHSQWVVSNACHIHAAWHWLPQRATCNALHKMLICRRSDNRRNASWGCDGGRDCGGNDDDDCSSVRWLNHSAELCNVRELMPSTNVKVKWCSRYIPCTCNLECMKRIKNS